LDVASLDLGYANDRSRVGLGTDPNVIDDISPIEMSVFHFDHDPIDSRGNGGFGYVGALKRHPHPERQLTSVQLFS